MANTARREAECQYFAFDKTAHPEYLFFDTQECQSVLTDLLFCVGSISSNNSDGPERDAYKQTSRSNAGLAFLYYRHDSRIRVDYAG